LFDFIEVAVNFDRMKNLITILLLTLMLTQAFSRFIYVLDYQVNKDFIAEFLCVNKSKPQLQCNGHCYLKKNLKKADETEKKSAGQNQKLDVTLFCQAFFRIAPVTFSGLVHYQASQPSLYRFSTCRNLFHPPQVIV